jgi:hypothetical protein
MKDPNGGKNDKSSPDFDGNVVKQDDELSKRPFREDRHNPAEDKPVERMKPLGGERVQ